MRKSLLLSDARFLPNVCAVYFILNNQGTVLYIGATQALRRRWRSHHRKQELTNLGAVSIEWESAPVKMLGEVEKKLIEEIRPCLNVSTAAYRHGTKLLTEDVHVYFPPKLLADLKKLAAQNRRSVTAEVVIAIEEKIKATKNGKGRAK